MSNVCQRPKQVLPRGFYRIACAPLHRTGRLLHKQPGAPATQTTHQIPGKSQLVGGARISRVRVGVVSYQINVFSPVKVV